MTFYSVSNPFMQVLNLKGTGLNDGDVYFGVAGQDPITHPITVYWDIDGMDEADQPIPTTGGYLYRNGTPANVFLASTYSIKVLEKGGSLIYYEPNVFDPVFQIAADLAAFEASIASSSGAGLVGWISRYASAIAGTVSDYLDDRCSVMHFIPFIERVKIRARTSSADLVSYFTAAAATGDQVWVPAGTYHVGSTVSLSTANTVFAGAGAGAVIVSSNPASPLFQLAADYLGFRDLTIQGTATTPQNAVLAINHTSGVSAKHCRIERVTFSGTDASHGHTNCIKFDVGADYPLVDSCHFERVRGYLDQQGICILNGGVTGGIFTRNTFIGTSDGLRHGVYLSANTTYCKIALNYAYATNFEAYTINTLSSQSPCQGNVIESNTVVNGAAANLGLTQSAISIFGKSQNNIIRDNVIVTSLANGIKIDGSQQMPNQNNRVMNNIIIAPAYRGIDVIDMAGGAITDNTIQNCSTVSTGTYAGIALSSGGGGGASGCQNIVISGNDISGADIRASLSLDATAPTPAGLIVNDNRFTAGALGQVDFNGVVCPINGRIEFGLGAFDPPSIANGAAYSVPGGIAVPGAEVGDIVTVSHSVTNVDGCAYFANVTANGTVSLNILNNSGGAKDIASGTLQLDIWKRP